MYARFCTWHGTYSNKPEPGPCLPGCYCLLAKCRYPGSPSVTISWGVPKAGWLLVFCLWRGVEHGAGLRVSPQGTHQLPDLSTFPASLLLLCSWFQLKSNFKDNRNKSCKSDFSPPPHPFLSLVSSQSPVVPVASLSLTASLHLPHLGSFEIPRCLPALLRTHSGLALPRTGHGHHLLG